MLANSAVSTEIWGVDGVIQDDMVTLFGFIARHNVYPSSYSFGTHPVKAAL
jgi:hypothetical protein